MQENDIVFWDISQMFLERCLEKMTNDAPKKIYLQVVSKLT